MILNITEKLIKSEYLPKRIKDFIFYKIWKPTYEDQILRQSTLFFPLIIFFELRANEIYEKKGFKAVLDKIKETEDIFLKYLEGYFKEKGWD